MADEPSIPGLNAAESSTGTIIATLLVVAALFAALSISVLWVLTSNFYAASYYTMSTLFGANSEGASVYIGDVLLHSSSIFNNAFYTFVGISLVDGFAKAVIIGFIIAAFIDLLSNIDIKSKLQSLTTKRMKNHVIICGYSMLAETLCKDLEKEQVHFIIIDKDTEKVNQLRDLKYNVIEGDFTERKVLENASLKSSRAVIFATESDFINLLGIVTAHHMYPDARIISRARFESSVRKIQRGGAEICLVPEIVAGIEVGERIARM